MNTRTLLSALALSLISVAASAQDAGSTQTPRIDQRQDNQAQRIDNGVASGQLNKREARRLERQQRGIHRAESAAKADGSLSKQERHKLRQAQRNSNGAIAKQKHDRQRVPHVLPGGPGTGAEVSPGG